MRRPARSATGATASERGMAARSECAIAGLRVPVRHRSRTSCLECSDRARSPHHPRRPSRTLALAMPRSLTRTGPCRLEPCRFEPCDSATRSAPQRCRRAAMALGPRRLRRSRRKAGGATREPWVGDRSRTGTRATTRVRCRSLGPRAIAARIGKTRAGPGENGDPARSAPSHRRRAVRRRQPRRFTAPRRSSGRRRGTSRDSPSTRSSCSHAPTAAPACSRSCTR